jgi:hypothetical protein
MKKIILFGLAIVLFTACNQKSVRYTQQSTEIETVKTLLKNYNNKSYDLSIYADSSKTLYNSSGILSPKEVVKYHNQNDVVYSNRSFQKEGEELEMVVDDKGRTWVNYWGDWKGSLAANQKEITIPIHLTYQFIDGKIVKEYGYWDPTEVLLSLQSIEAAKQAEEETVTN